MGSVSMPSRASAALRLLDRGLQLVDPQVDRRRRLEGGDLAAPGLAVGFDQMRRHPLLHVEADPVGLLGMGQRMALHLAQRADFGLVERLPGGSGRRRTSPRPAPTVACRPASGRRRRWRGPAIRVARALEPPEELAVAAQDAPDALGHGAAIAAADEAAGAEKGVGTRSAGRSERLTISSRSSMVAATRAPGVTSIPFQPLPLR